MLSAKRRREAGNYDDAWQTRPLLWTYACLPGSQRILSVERAHWDPYLEASRRSPCLAGLGTYGLISYAVSQRTREIGIRTALGAQSEDVLRLIVQEGMGLALVGLTIGLFAGLVTARFLGGFLYGVKPNDPVTFACVALLLAGTAALACYLPAQRAIRVEPLVALRHE